MLLCAGVLKRLKRGAPWTSPPFLLVNTSTLIQPGPDRIWHPAPSQYVHNYRVGDRVWVRVGVRVRARIRVSEIAYGMQLRAAVHGR